MVDGQQRLTTISILLVCIAEKLKETGRTGQWGSEDISRVYLRNQLDPPRKLKLQDHDDEEYKRIIERNSGGDGKVTQAWKVLRSEVTSAGPDCLMKGLSRFKVISFTCESFDDPQQIFESLNATGVPLTEGEKVKNWLLMGLDRESQDRLYIDHWYRLEQSLGAVAAPKRIDEFLRDFLRWKTGETYGIDQTYANLRRWWYETEGSRDRTSLCEQLARLAELYGKITGTNGQHENKEVDELLQYLRDFGIDVHRPFTLRLLSDEAGAADVSRADLVKVLRALSTWLTRLWLAKASTSGLNTESTRFANHRVPQNVESYANYWIDKIRRLWGTGIAVPNEEEIGVGIRKRRAYGGKASNAARTILWEINSQLSNAANPKREELSIEHIMPRKLSQEWRDYLGEDADNLHENCVHTLANLTLVGERFNPEISNQIYKEKHKLYKKSSFELTRKLAESYVNWTQEDIEDRAQKLTGLVLKYWPWENVSRTKVRWRIGDNEWQEEKTFKNMLLNVAAALIDIDPLENSKRILDGKYFRGGGRYIFRSGTRREGRCLPIPRYDEYVISVDIWDKYKTLLCYEMGKRCGVEIVVEFLKDSTVGERVWGRVDLPLLYANGEKRTRLRWRINEDDWLEEQAYPGLLLNVAAALLDLEPEENGNRLLNMKHMGNRTYFFRSETSASSRCKLIPGHDEYKINVGLMHMTIVKLCREMGELCGVKVVIEILKDSTKGEQIWERLDSNDPMLEA